MNTRNIRLAEETRHELILLLERNGHDPLPVERELLQRALLVIEDLLLVLTDEPRLQAIVQHLETMWEGTDAVHRRNARLKRELSECKRALSEWLAEESEDEEPPGDSSAHV